MPQWEQRWEWICIIYKHVSSKREEQALNESIHSAIISLLAWDILHFQAKILTIFSSQTIAVWFPLLAKSS